MRQLIASSLLFLLVFQVHDLAHSQSCSWRPADCPGDPILTDSEDSLSYVQQFHHPREISMMIRMHRELTKIMEDISAATNWKMYSFIESGGSGIGIEENTKPLPYSLRPPHEYGISFIFIVNEDSLNAWRNWQKEVLLPAAMQVVEENKNAGESVSTDDRYKHYLDSANWYLQKQSEFATSHAAEYQSAVLSADKKAIKAYDDEMNRFQKKVNECIDKANGRKDEKWAQTNKDNEDFQEMRHMKTVAFRNSCMIRIKFDINVPLLQVSSEDKFQYIKPISVPHASVALHYHNAHPKENEVFELNQFTRSPDLILLLVGPWQTKPDKSGLYHSGFELNKANLDYVSVKKTPCEQVQTIGIHVEGAPAYMNRFLEKLNLEKIELLLK
ncbi:MAG: hypothetical protein ACJ75B_15245 [Flavisolibacter sp.]